MHIVNLHGMVISTAPNAHIYSRDLSNCNFIKTNQDTHQRTLDIRFVDDELALHKTGRIRGSSFAVTNKQYTEIQLRARAADDDCPNFNYGLT